MINFLRISKNIKLGDYLHSNGDINNIASKDIIGVCVIPSNFLPDGRARFISMVAMDPEDRERGNHIGEPGVVWYSYRGNFRCNFLVQRNKVPLNNDNSKGIIDGHSTWGYISAFNSYNINLTIPNPQDPWTRYYYRAINRIPSPYSLDGSFNPNFHYRGSENDEWALTDYRGDLNTRDVVYTKDHGENRCPAFYCCGRFSPGYGNHEWYLPAIGELAFIPPRLDIINNKMKEAINAGSPGVVLSNSNYWSSSEASRNDAWYVYLYNGYVSSVIKGIDYYVRAFLAI